MTAFVQIVASGGGTAGTNPLVLTLGAGITTSLGNTLSLQVRMTSARTLSSVTDSKGNTWNVDLPSTSTGSGCALASCNITTPLVAADTITITFSGTCTPFAGVAEFSGVGTNAGLPNLDATADLINSSGLSVAPELAAVVSQPNELAITCMGTSSSTATCSVTAADPDSGGTWTAIAYGIDALGAAYQVGPASTTKFKASWTASAGSNCEGMIATYEAPAIPQSSADVSAAAAEGLAKIGVDDAVGYP